MLAAFLACEAAPGGTLDPVPYPVWEATITDLQAAMASGRVTSEELVAAYLLRITAYDGTGSGLRTMIRLNPNARAEAAALDEERRTTGPRGPLHGIPIVLKDNYDTGDLPTTAGSVSLAGARPGQDGFVAGKLRAAGAVLLGKTNMNEFALGMTTLSSLGGQTRNPYDPARYPGGSSGGTAAAVASNFATVGWGTDTCGSIRVPASFNSLFGLRPTKGITSVQGIIPLSHSQDVSGPLARTAMDLAITLDATVGLDPADGASAAWSEGSLPRFVESLDSMALDGARVGVLQDAFGLGPTEREVNDTVRAAIRRMEQAGAQVVEVNVPRLQDLAMESSLIAFEFRDDLRSYLSRHPDYPVGDLTQILESGLYLSSLGALYDSLNVHPNTASSAYRTASAKRDSLRSLLREVLRRDRLDALVYPTVPAPPQLIGDRQHDPNCELSANTGFPALTIPVGFTASGLPVGMELLGAPLSDARLVSMGYAFERLAARRLPPAYTPRLDRDSAPAPDTLEVRVTADAMLAIVSFVFDAPRGRLTYRTVVTGLPSEKLLSVSLHQKPPLPGEGSAVNGPAVSGNGPVVVALALPNVLRNEGVVTLSIPGREALYDGRLYVTVLTTDHPSGTLRGTLPPPDAPGLRQPQPRQ